MDYSNLFVCLMGIGTVFVGLVCIILLVTLMSYVCRKSDAKSVAPTPAGADCRRLRRHRRGYGHRHFSHPYYFYETNLIWRIL